MYRETCGKCDGTGVINWARHVKGGVCFTCDGRGYLEYKTSPAVRAKARARREAKRLKASLGSREAAQSASENREATYRNDPRIGAKTRASMAHETYAFEIYSLLAKIDRGEITGRERERILQNIGEDYVMTFGKHRGKRLADVPTSYLQWLVEGERLPRDMHEEADRLLG